MFSPLSTELRQELRRSPSVEKRANEIQRQTAKNPGAHGTACRARSKVSRVNDEHADLYGRHLCNVCYVLTFRDGHATKNPGADI